MFMLSLFMNGFYSGFYVLGAMVMPLVAIIILARISRRFMKPRAVSPQVLSMLERFQKMNPNAKHSAVTTYDKQMGKK